MKFFAKVQLFYRALFDKRTPKIVKILTVFALLYGLSPLDILPDILPLVGQLDDIIVIVTLLMQAFKLIPPGMKKEHTDAPEPTTARKFNMKDVIDV